MGTIGCCDDRHVLNQIDSPRNNKNNKKENTKQDDAENQKILEFKIDPSPSIKDQSHSRDSHSKHHLLPPSRAAVPIEKTTQNKNEESFLSTNLDSNENNQPNYKRKRKTDPYSKLNVSTYRKDDSKEIKVENPENKTISNNETVNIKTLEISNNLSENHKPDISIDRIQEPLLLMKKESSGIQGKNPYRKDKKFSKTMQNITNNSIPEDSKDNEQREVKNNDSIILKSSYSNQIDQESNLNKEKETNKQVISEQKTEYKRQIDESLINNLENSLKFKRSHNDKKANGIPNNRIKTDSVQIKESGNDLIVEEKPKTNAENLKKNAITFTERIRAMESKNVNSMKSYDQIEVLKVKKLDKISEKEHKFLNDSFNLMRSSTSREKNIKEEVVRKPMKMRSQKIMKMAQALEKHLLGDGKVNPDNVKEDNQFDDMLNNRSIVCRHVRKKNRNFFV